jgi:hypothetical protein
MEYIETETKTQPIKNILNGVSAAFHKFGLWILVSIAIGIYVGISACKTFYVAKLDDVVKVGGMVHKEKVYGVTPK